MMWYRRFNIYKIDIIFANDRYLEFNYFRIEDLFDETDNEYVEILDEEEETPSECMWYLFFIPFSYMITIFFF